MAEDRGSCNQHPGAGLDHFQSRMRFDPSIDFQFTFGITLIEPLSNRLDLSKSRLDKMLPAESGIDRHDKHEIKILNDFIQEVRRG